MKTKQHAVPRAHITVDVDPLRCYAEIHGLAPELLTEETFNAVYEKGMLRFLDLFDRFGIRATLFVVSSDLGEASHAGIPPIAMPGVSSKMFARNRGLMREASQRGHEIASHTHSHPYNFDHLPVPRQELEIACASQIIKDAVGQAPVGFRAPGYNFREEMTPLLMKHGIRYDASPLPSRGYYLLRAAMIAKIRALGGQSASQLGRYRNFALGAGAKSRIVAHQGAVIRQHPISVLPGMGLPMVGTFLAMLGPARLEAALGFAAELDPLHIEFHGVDLLDLERDALPPALAVQKDLCIPLERKLAVMERLFRFLDGRFDVVPLRDADHAG
jgi:peptidoglycan-N-acetylglucosamine deacetylase